MTRTLLSLFALLVCLSALASPVPIAPLEPRFGDLDYDDYAARSATDGRTTLIVWINTMTPFPLSNRLMGVFIGPDGAAKNTAFPIAFPGSGHIVATNGQEYLVGYGISTSRSITDPYSNVAVRTITSEGVVGEPRFVNTSDYIYPSLSGIEWADDQWIIDFYDGTSHLAFLDRDLNTKHTTIDVPFSRMIRIGSRPYLFAVTNGVATAYEIVDGALIARSSLALGKDAYLSAVATRSGAIVTLESNVVELSTFSPAVGWSAPTKVVEGQHLIGGVAPFGDGAILLRYKSSSSTSIEGTVVDAEGKVVETATIGDFFSAFVIASHGGSLLVASAQTPLTRTALYTYPFARLHKVSDSEGHLVSVTRIDRQFQPLLCSAGSYAVAFWNQTIDDEGRVAAFSRRVDATGNPIGDPVQLPFALGRDATVAFTGTRFVIVWYQSAVSVSADGTSAGPVMGLEALAPQIAAAGRNLFVLDNGMRGIPLREDGSMIVPGGFPVLPSIRSQFGVHIAPLASNFVAVWKEESDIGSMVISPAGTPSAVKMIGRDVSGALSLGGDAQAALAGWLSPRGQPVLVAIDSQGGSFDLFNPHWGDGFSTMTVRASNHPSHFFVSLVRDGVLFVGETGQSGSFITEVDPLRPIAKMGLTFDLAAAGNTPIAIWNDDRRVWVSAPAPQRQRLVRGR